MVWEEKDENLENIVQKELYNNTAAKLELTIYITLRDRDWVVLMENYAKHQDYRLIVIDLKDIFEWME